MTALKFPRHTPRHGDDWIIDPAFLQRVLHSIEPGHPHEFTPTPEQVEVTLLALEVIPSNLYTAPPAQRTWAGLTDEERRSIREWQRIQEELGPVWAPMMLYLYEAIEAKLKEKNT